MLRFVQTRNIYAVAATAAIVFTLLGVSLGLGWLAFSIAMLVLIGIGACSVARSVREGVDQADAGYLQRKRLTTLSAIFAGFFSLLLTVLIPPLQSPDEPAHIARAYALLDDDIAVKDLGSRTNQEIDAGLIAYSRSWGYLPYRAEQQVTQELAERSRRLHWEDKTAVYYNPAAIYFPALYAPAAVGMGLTKAMQQPPWSVVSWARFGMWAFAVACFLLALYIAQGGHAVMAASMLLPMTLAQTGSANLDAATIPASYLLLALYTWLFSPVEATAPTTVKRWGLLSSWLLLSLLALAKPIFLVFLVLPVALAWTRRKPALALPSLVVLALVLAWQGHVAQSFANPNPDLLDSPFSRLWEALIAPRETSLLVWATIDAKFDFYWQSMVGILGWLDTPLGQGTYFSASVLLAASLVSDAMRPRSIGARTRLAFWLTFIAYCLGTLLLLWATWTPPGNPVIEGVQGRYFLPLLPALSMGVSGLLLTRSGHALQFARWYDGALLIFFALYAACLTVDLSSILIVRYWL